MTGDNDMPNPTPKELVEAAGKAAELIYGAATGQQYNPSPQTSNRPPSLETGEPPYADHAPLPDSHPDAQK